MLQSKGIEVVHEADNGEDLLAKVKVLLPDVVLMDINMPVMDGIEATRLLKKHYPAVRVIALSMFNDETNIIRMIRSGARGYLLKDAEPGELMMAIKEVMDKGYFYTELVAGTLVNSVVGKTEPVPESDVEENSETSISEREKTFLRFVCSEMHYKEIAIAMNASPRTIDGYRDALFEKLKLKSRIGLVIYAIRMKLFDPHANDPTNNTV